MLALLLGLCSCNNRNPVQATDENDSVTEMSAIAAESPSEEEIMMQQIENYNYILGTQAFNPNYQFTDEIAEMEIAGRITEMGSNMIKFYAKDDTMIDDLMEKYHFRYVFMWYRSDPYFRDGYSEEEAQADYEAFYHYTKKLLTTYNGSGVEFYLGHWEGDWYYLDNYNTAQVEVSEQITQGMIAWINNRQKAVDDAKRDTPHENVYVWNYLEINRPSDALRDKCDRVVNRVLPYTNVDYVSYSAYDTMDQSARQVARVIEDIYDNLPEKEGIPEPRVFIGEVGQPAANCGFDGEKHRDTNLANISKYLACDVKFVLYWQMYCNEKLEDGSSRGFYLINDNNEKQPLYDSFESILAGAKIYVKTFLEENGRVPDHTEYRNYLLSLPEFSK